MDLAFSLFLSLSLFLFAYFEHFQFNRSEQLLAYLSRCVLAVFEYDHALAFIDIAAVETKPMARRFEVYGTKGSAILIEPFEPGSQIRLCLDKARDGFKEGEQFVPIDAQPRQALYDLALNAFLATIHGQQEPDRSYEHELLVQETLLRATGSI